MTPLTPTCQHACVQLKQSPVSPIIQTPSNNNNNPCWRRPFHQSRLVPAARCTALLPAIARPGIASASAGALFHIRACVSLCHLSRAGPQFKTCYFKPNGTVSLKPDGFTRSCVCRGLPSPTHPKSGAISPATVGVMVIGGLVVACESYVTFPIFYPGGHCTLYMNIVPGPSQSESVRLLLQLSSRSACTTRDTLDP